MYSSICVRVSYYLDIKTCGKQHFSSCTTNDNYFIWGHIIVIYRSTYVSDLCGKFAKKKEKKKAANADQRREGT